MPAASKDTISFLYKLLAYDPNNRPTAEQALKH
jgi:serine/threonine protein kinase